MIEFFQVRPIGTICYYCLDGDELLLSHPLSVPALQHGLAIAATLINICIQAQKYTLNKLLTCQRHLFNAHHRRLVSSKGARFASDEKITVLLVSSTNNVDNFSQLESTFQNKTKIQKQQENIANLNYRQRLID